MLNFRYRRLVPPVFRSLRRSHRLSYPNQWLGSAEQTVPRRDAVFLGQVDATVKRMFSSGNATADTGVDAAQQQPAAAAGPRQSVPTQR